MKKNILLSVLTSLLTILLTFPAFGVGGNSAYAITKDYYGKSGPGAVFIMTNAAEGNEIMMYQRSAIGRLSYMDQFPTGGLGAGVGKTIEIDPLGSQNSLILDEKGEYLYAVNAGDDTITVFQVRENYLKFLDNVPSGGCFPVSLTVHDKVLYVLNAGANDGSGSWTPGNITGFMLEDNHLVPIADSTRTLAPSICAVETFT